MRNLTKPIKKSVKQAYQSAGWSAPKIAAAMGINHISVYRWQAGEYRPRLDVAMKFAELCGLRMDEIDWGGETDEEIAVSKSATVSPSGATMHVCAACGRRSRAGEKVVDVRFDEDTMSVDLADCRTITVPLAWYPRLLDATPDQRQNWQRSGGGFGIHWPDLDEDLSTQGLLEGASAPRRAATAPKKTPPS